MAQTKRLHAASAQRDVVRGVLILLVILDHNDIVRNVRAVQDWFMPMTLHVTGFLMLPFLASPLRPTFAGTIDRMARYLVPFLLATIAYAVAFHAIITPQTPLAVAFQDTVVATAIASTPLLQTATGFVVLWFLPALFSTVLLYGVIGDTTGWRRWMLLAAATGVHLTVGSAPLWLRTWVPQGFLIAGYMLPLGLMLRCLVSVVQPGRRPILTTAICGAVVFLCWRAQLGMEVEVATLQLPTWREPLQVVVTDAADLAFLLLLLAAAPLLARLRPLVVLGRHSLLVYLAHPLITKVALMALLPTSVKLLKGGEMLAYWNLAASSVAIIAAISVLVAVMTSRLAPLRDLVTPRDFQGWLPVTLLRAAPFRAKQIQAEGAD